MNFQRIFLIVLDSVGIGALPDAAQYGDAGANTLANTARNVGGLNVPNMEKLGLGNIEPIQGVKQVYNPISFYTKIKEASVGKDTMTGHWELMGLRVEKPFQTFPNGFPDSLISELERLTNRKVLGNKPASGTVIIEELGEEHMKTGGLIVYTSSDSVLQIAAHEEIIPLQELYDICQLARTLTLKEEWMVGRVIARPFIGEKGQFVRTANRRDYAVKPFAPTVLNSLQEKEFDVISIGKIYDIFDGEGITQAIHTKDNADGMRKLLDTMKADFSGLAFLNLVDFDSKYGHRRNPKGYAKALEAFDKSLTYVLDSLRNDDLLIMTADHGNDPTYHGTDHTREYVPLIVYHRKIHTGGKLPVRETFADVGATIADNFYVKRPPNGTSFLEDILTN